MTRDYRWTELKTRGDWVLNPGTSVNQVARLAKRYVARHLPEGSQVVTVTVPDGTVTFLSYVPPSVVVTEPAVKPPTKRDQLAEDRVTRREARDREVEERNTAELRATFKRVAEPTMESGPVLQPTKNDKIVEALHEAFTRGDSAQERADLEDHLQRTLPEDDVASVEPDDEPDDWDEVDESVG